MRVAAFLPPQRYLSAGMPRAERFVALRATKKAKSSETKAGKLSFADWKRVKVSGGNGGDGCISLLSVFKVEFAGPDGGSGGHGGHVIFKATQEVSSLQHLPECITAADGITGKNKNCDGKNAKHNIVPVPCGTIFRNMEGEVVAELVQKGSMFLAARGGAGGKGNALFKTSIKQTPVIAEAGGRAETFIFDVELMCMADVGLVGFPNAGKSTLLRAVSRARPRVAAYPFTTLNPHIGMVPFNDYTQIAVADIPGIIPDAHKNKGLGISFLRHIERCACLLYVIDMSQLDPHQQLLALKFELEKYQPGLTDRPHAVVANKMDLEKSRTNLSCFIESLRQTSSSPIFEISGKYGRNISPLLYYMRRMYDQKHEKSHIR